RWPQGDRERHRARSSDRRDPEFGNLTGRRRALERVPGAVAVAYVSIVTFSIVGRSAEGDYGVAVASKFLAVGSGVPAAEAGVGALATQSYANLAYRPHGLTMLRTGVAAADVVAGLTAADPQHATRQLGVVGPVGDGATFTGDECHAWAGGLVGDGY